MLKLTKIKKDYPAGGGVVHALKGIDLSFRRAEFVAILGPSGCGKTTLLNIVGGLDGYSEGDLVINGISTKKYKDRDWDAYRNHSVGFVFQSYNLITHQSVLQNVELALTLSGVSRAERRARAKKALEDVGLGDQLKKKPGEMSGGQMQRVAIARALVNNPDIILADEPTGALDTETSVQVMEILEKVAKDRLVVMVTHNPELAERYATRTIRMLDGVITKDSRPLDAAEEAAALAEGEEKRQKGKKGKKDKMPSMSFGTSFMLSLKNLFTKKGRTTLTAFAGSIGIIGIALILAMSQGMTAYINAVQESTLSAYPITLEATTVEMSSLMEAFMHVASQENGHGTDAVYKKSALYDMLNAVNSIEEQKNDLKAFRAYLMEEMAKEDSPLTEAVNGIEYTYDLSLEIYTKNVDGTILHSDLEKILGDLMVQYIGVDMTQMADMSPMSGMSSTMAMSTVRLWQQLLPGTDGSPVNDLLLDQYEVVYGSWPNRYNQVVLVLDQNNELDDVTLYALGLLSEADMEALADAAVNGAPLPEGKDRSWTYEEICQRQYRAILPADCYHYDEASDAYLDLRETDAGLRYLYDNAMELSVVGVIRPRADADVAMLQGGIAYTQDLTRHLIQKGQESELVALQQANLHTDVLTGFSFSSVSGTLSEEEKDTILKEHLASLSEAERADAFVKISSIPSEDFVKSQVDAQLSAVTREDMEATMASGMHAQMGVSEEEILSYLSAMEDGEIRELFAQMVEEQVRAGYAAQVTAQMASLPEAQLSAMLTTALPTYTPAQCAIYYDEIMTFSESSYEENLRLLGYVEEDSPATINLYASSFENKDVISEAIDLYNDGVEELKQIKYTDYLAIMMSSITTIINAITYVLIAFVAVSLVVSSIMIGVITLISVQERTKEIGILRAIGASKREVSAMFNAETMIVGFASGLLGIVVTYLLCIPVNMILHYFTGIANLKAILPPAAAVILVVISVCLTLVSGLIPSKSAAKKDPVVALRTE